jgi:hypothetical protein
MHPTELRNKALVAATIAEQNGFLSTAEAFRQIALSCCFDAYDLKKNRTRRFLPIDVPLALISPVALATL